MTNFSNDELRMCDGERMMSEYRIISYECAIANFVTAAARSSFKNRHSSLAHSSFASHPIVFEGFRDGF
jgi:hypothetical protein